MTSKGVMLFAFSAEHAGRVTGLTLSRLTRWDRLGFFSPELADPADRGNAFARVYSFNDLVGLRTLAILADKYRVPLAELRKAHDILAKQGGKPWSERKLTVAKRKVVVYDDQGRPVNVTDGQYSFTDIPLPEIARDVREKAEGLRKRDSSKFGVIERHRFVAHNAPIIAGTRIPVTAIESFLRAGYTDAEIVSEYPSLDKFDVATVRRQMKAAA